MANSFERGNYYPKIHLKVSFIFSDYCIRSNFFNRTALKGMFSWQLDRPPSAAPPSSNPIIIIHRFNYFNVVFEYSPSNGDVGDKILATRDADVGDLIMQRHGWLPCEILLIINRSSL